MVILKVEFVTAETNTNGPAVGNSRGWRLWTLFTHQAFWGKASEQMPALASGFLAATI